ncbi:MAG: metallophosphoesterase [Candidatus Hydrogenedentes bacterium]|nr:metallophosphoesterase [Candidatus Hydrogenedentota bacterium]
MTTGDTPWPSIGDSEDWPVGNAPRVGYVISDLHMFSKRSESRAHEPAIFEYAAKADFFILNGDTFDFRWTTLPTIDQTVYEAIAWLRNLAERFPKCHFHFILGNHDNNQAFIAALSKLVAKTENLSWHPYYLRLGDSVFLHGDVSDKPMMGAAGLEKHREEWLLDTPKHAIFHSIYDMVVHVGLHRMAVAAKYPKKRVVRRVLEYLDDVGLTKDNDIKHVYFGHTHGAMQNFEYGGLLFHNAGSPMKGLEFNILKVEIED